VAPLCGGQLRAGEPETVRRTRNVMLGIVSTFMIALLQNRAFVVDHPCCATPLSRGSSTGEWRKTCP